MNLLNYIKKNRLTVAFSIVALGLVFLAIASRIKNPAVLETARDTPTVSLISVSDYREQKTVNLDNGTVQSLGQADLKSQITEPIAAANVKLGDSVAAGQLLVQLQNNDIRAQLDQAQAQLDGLEKGARPEDIALSQTGRDQAQASLVSSIKNSYSSSDDAVHNHVDKFFANPRQSNAVFLVVINIGSGQTTFHASDTDLASQINGQKYTLEKNLGGWQAAAMDLEPTSTTSDIENALALSKANLQKEIDFLNEMAPLVNGLSSGDVTYKQIIDGYKAEFSAARTTMNGALSALQGSETAWRSAQLALNLKVAGASSDQIKAAQAAVDGLRATLAKTSIVSPISGKVSYLSANVGELASSGQLIASVVNPNSLKVTAYVSESDRPLIAAGDPAIINGKIKGIVRSVSPVINSQTKNAQVDIIVTDSGNALVAGQNARVSIAAKVLAKTSDAYLLPIQAVQFSGANNQNYVFTVNSENTLTSVPVTTGALIGENVEITSGLTPDMKIISAVTGFETGEKVNIQ
jgi:multidrug efflux pump subunit AcrA (membrane-fusion protein)